MAVVDILIVVVALMGSAALPSLAGGEGSTILMRLATSVLPDVPGALLAAAITAVIVSAATTFLLAAATCVVHDLARLETAGDEEGAIWPARYAVAGIAVAALMLLQVFPQALAAALWAFMMYGAVITPPLMAAFFVPRVTPRAALAGMVAAIAGAMAVLAFAPAIPAIFPALLLSVFTMAAVSAGGHRASLDTA
jgi:Na+/proline symporter